MDFGIISQNTQDDVQDINTFSIDDEIAAEEASDNNIVVPEFQFTLSDQEIAMLIIFAVRNRGNYAF